MRDFISFLKLNEIDNRIVNDGDFAGSSGSITVLDGGALEIAESIALTALDNNALVVDRALDFGESAINEVGSVSVSAIDAINDNSARAMREVTDNSRFAIDSVNDFGSRVVGELSNVSGFAIDTVTDFSAEALEELTENTRVFSDNLTQVSQASMANNSQVLAAAAQSNSEDKAIIAELARNTSLAGQDIVAKSSEKMTMYMAIALAFGFVFMSFRSN